ncbi:MAG: hypothetical protein NTW86_15615 [Candidatus Sumerlaeota bacterium]|nr:hypothetical protein [Candidatus Sumerlaeota bacterium]
MERDRYGGFLAVKSKATGYFRLEMVDRRWWFITPDGHGFIAVGFNHASPKFLEASYNREYWDKTLPTPQAFEEMAIADAKAWKMTMIGYGAVKPRGRFPYLLRVTFPGPSCWMPEPTYADMFSPEFEAACDSAARTTCTPAAEDPMLIGYAMNDVPEWPILGRVSKRRAMNWIDHIKSRGLDSPGKHAYVSLIRQRHGGIESFNAAYDTHFRSWDELIADGDFVYNVLLKPEIARADDEAFLSLMTDRYYEVGCQAIRRADPNHLLLGEILDGNRGLPREVLATARGRIDALSTQFYGFLKEQAPFLESWHRDSGKPILLADSSFGMRTEALPEAVGPRLHSQEERAREFERYARQALGVPYIVGWIWCGYIDASAEVERRNQHHGIKDAWGNPHEPLSSRIAATYAELFDIASGK